MWASLKVKSWEADYEVASLTRPQTRLRSIARDHAFTLVLASIAALHCALFVYFVERASLRVPVYDFLDWLVFYDNRMQAGDWLGYLWGAHNEHRIVLSRILLAADVRWFGGDGTAFVVSGFVLLIGMIGVLCREIWKSNLLSSWKAVAIPCLIIVLTPVATVITIGVPVFGVFLQTAAFAVFAVVLMDGAGEESRWSNWRRAAALGAGCLSGFGISGGLLIWPVLLWAAWRGKLGWRWIGVIAAVGAAFIAVYLRGLPVPAESRLLSMGHPIEMFDYAIRFLGLPWSHLHQLVWPSRLVGLCLLGLGGYLLVDDGLSATATPRLQRVGLALVLFVLLLAAAAVSARADVAEDREMPIRYTLLVVLAHVGFLLFALPLLQRVWDGPRRLLLQCAMLTFAVALVCQQVIAGKYAVQEANRYKEAWTRFAAGEWSPDMLHYVYPDRDAAQAMVARLRQMGLYQGN
jgi:hypothetical protein